MGKIFSKLAIPALMTTGSTAFASSNDGHVKSQPHRQNNPLPVIPERPVATDERLSEREVKQTISNVLLIMKSIFVSVSARCKCSER